MTKLIAFCGGMGCGKDTYGTEYSKQAGNAVKYSFATPLRKECEDFFRFLTHNNVGLENLRKHFNLTTDEFNNVLEIIKDEKVLNPYLRTPAMRKLLQYWGTDIRRNKDENYWVDKTIKDIKELLNKGKNVYLTDARFFNEFQAIKDIGGTLVYLETDDEERIKRIIARDNIKPSKEVLNHASEQDWKIFNDYDIIINTTKVGISNISKEISKILQEQQG